MKEKTKAARTFGFRAILLVCALLTGAVVSAQEAAQDGAAIEIIRSGIPHDALFAIEMSGQSGFAVGGFGLMLETADGGVTWTVVPPKTSLAMLGVARAGDRHIIVGQKGLVMTRKGDGEWTLVDSGIDQRLMNVSLHESGYAVAVGEFGFVTRSKDFGATWEPIVLEWGQYNEEGYEPHLYDAFIEEDGSAMIVGEFGLILRSEDGGDTWNAVHQGDQSVFALNFAKDNPNVGFAVGQEGLILKTTDAGQSWQPLDGKTDANLLGVWTGNGEVVIAGIRSLLRSSDDGSSFIKTDDLNIVRTWFQGIAAGTTETKAGAEGFLRQQFVYVVGHTGTIARVLQ